MHAVNNSQYFTAFCSQAYKHPCRPEAVRRHRAGLISFAEAKKQLHCALSVSGNTTTAMSLISHVSHAVKLSETCTSNRTVSSTAAHLIPVTNVITSQAPENLTLLTSKGIPPSLATQYSGLAPS